MNETSYRRVSVSVNLSDPRPLGIQISFTEGRRGKEEWNEPRNLWLMGSIRIIGRMPGYKNGNLIVDEAFGMPTKLVASASVSQPNYEMWSKADGATLVWAAAVDAKGNVTGPKIVHTPDLSKVVSALNNKKNFPTELFSGSSTIVLHFILDEQDILEPPAQWFNPHPSTFSLLGLWQRTYQFRSSSVAFATSLLDSAVSSPHFASSKFTNLVFSAMGSLMLTTVIVGPMNLWSNITNTALGINALGPLRGVSDFAIGSLGIGTLAWAMLRLSTEAVQSYRRQGASTYERAIAIIAGFTPIFLLCFWFCGSSMATHATAIGQIAEVSSLIQAGMLLLKIGIGSFFGHRDERSEARLAGLGVGAVLPIFDSLLTYIFPKNSFLDLDMFSAGVSAASVLMNLYKFDGKTVTMTMYQDLVKWAAIDADKVSVGLSSLLQQVRRTDIVTDIHGEGPNSDALRKIVAFRERVANIKHLDEIGFLALPTASFMMFTATVLRTIRETTSSSHATPAKLSQRELAGQAAAQRLAPQHLTNNPPSKKDLQLSAAERRLAPLSLLPPPSTQQLTKTPQKEPASSPPTKSLDKRKQMESEEQLKKRRNL